MAEITKDDIAGLLSRDDWRWLRQQLARIPEGRRHFAKREWGARFVDAYNAEEIEYRQINAGRRAANLWLLEYDPFTEAE